MSEWKDCQGSKSLHILRLIVLLNWLVDCPYGVSTSALLKHLRAHNLIVSMRQLQRDLLFLAKYFRIDGRTNRSGHRCWYSIAGSWWPDTERSDGKACEPGSILQREQLPFHGSLRSIEGPGRVDSRMLKLARILSLVELLPTEEDDVWASIPELLAGLKGLGFTACQRSVQRDMLFVRKHFLILEHTRGRRKEWQRLESEGWECVFEPRCPEPVEREHPEVNAFLYGRRAPGGSPRLASAV